MAPITLRRECPCRSSPVITGRVDEEAIGWGPFLRLAIFGFALGFAHLYAGGWGWIGWVAVGSLDLLWVLMFLFVVGEARAQRRQGLGYVRVGASSFRLGDRLALQVAAERGFAGLSRIEVSLRCVDAVMEDREVTVAEGGQKGTEPVQICYAVWEDSRSVDAARLEGRSEASFEFTLPKAGDLPEPPRGGLERYWEIEVDRRGGASALRHRVLVYP